MKANEAPEKVYIEPIFNVGDYISPIKKSMFCELDDIGRIISIDDYTYIVKIKSGRIVRVHIQFQEYYRNIIPNKQQEIDL